MFPPKDLIAAKEESEPSQNFAEVFKRLSGYLHSYQIPDLSKWMSVEFRRKVIRSSPFQVPFLPKLCDWDLGVYKTTLCQEFSAR